MNPAGFIKLGFSVLCLRAVTENTVKSMCQLLLLLLLVVPLIFPKDKFNLRFLGPCLVQLCWVVLIYHIITPGGSPYILMRVCSPQIQRSVWLSNFKTVVSMRVNSSWAVLIEPLVCHCNISRKHLNFWTFDPLCLTSSTAAESFNLSSCHHSHCLSTRL